MVVGVELCWLVCRFVSCLRLGRLSSKSTMHPSHGSQGRRSAMDQNFDTGAGTFWDSETANQPSSAYALACRRDDKNSEKRCARKSNSACCHAKVF
jgi:hypothetical protein